LTAPSLVMTGIKKSFPGVKALKGVSFEAFPGESLAMIGANGAGKSTLMNILGGVVLPDEGQISIDGKETLIHSPSEAARRGIAFVHQELALMPTLSILDNMLISSFPTRNGLIDYDRGEVLCREALSRLGYEFNLRMQVRDLSPGDQQIVEIARTLLGKSRIVIYITHLLDEIFTICEKAVILRNGEKVAQSAVKELTRDGIVEKMIGSQEVVSYFQHHARQPGPELLTVENLQREGYLDNINFSIHRGEVVGLWGLLGSGRTELFRAMMGLDQITGGRILVDMGRGARPIRPRSGKNPMGLVTEDRRTDGLLLPLSIRNNLSLANLRNFISRLWPFIARTREEAAANEYVRKLNIKSTSIEQRVATLSGGNQQKVVVGRWLQTNPLVFLMDEPTRGLDVEAKAELHSIISGLADSGAAVLFVSSDLDEIMSLSDRFLVMVRGRLVKELPRETTKHELLATASGITATKGGA
jgi:ABC-type sugar transport system ATPase subunit